MISAVPVSFLSFLKNIQHTGQSFVRSLSLQGCLSLARMAVTHHSVFEHRVFSILHSGKIAPVQEHSPPVRQVVVQECGHCERSVTPGVVRRS